MSNGRGFWDASVVLSAAAQRFHSPVTITSPYDGNALELSLFVYCRNNGAAVEAALNTITDAMRIVNISYEILIIDDASQDQSVEALRRFVETHSGIPIVLRLNREPKGLPENYADAAFMGQGKYLRFISARYNEPMETLIDILKATGEADIVVPYYIASMQESEPRRRLSKAYARLLNAACGYTINDYGVSPLHLRFNVMRWHANSKSDNFEARLLCHLLALGFTWKQVPCRTHHRRPIRLRELCALPRLLGEIILRRIVEKL